MRIERVGEISTKTRRDKDGKLVSTIQAEVRMSPAALAELHDLIEKGVALNIEIGTRQAEFGKDK